MGYCNYLRQQKIKDQKNWFKKHFESMQKFGQQRYTGQKNLLAQCKNLRQQKIKDLKLWSKTLTNDLHHEIKSKKYNFGSWLYRQKKFWVSKN